MFNSYGARLSADGRDNGIGGQAPVGPVCNASYVAHLMAQQRHWRKARVILNRSAQFGGRAPVGPSHH